MRKQFYCSLLVLMVVAASCGGSSGESVSAPSNVDETEAAPEVSTGVEESGSTSDASDEAEPVDGDASQTQEPELVEEPTQPQTMDEYRDLWEANRELTVERILASGYGRQGDRIIGPEGFDVDLSSCGAGWDDGGGVSDDTISIGLVASLSGGTLGSYGIAEVSGIEAYFDWVNAEEPIGDRRIELVTQDGLLETGNGPQRAEAAADRLLGSTGILAMVEARAGFPSATQDVANQACVISTSYQSPDPSYGQPQTHPWSVSIDFNYATEVTAWCEALAEMGSEVATVGFLVSDNENRSWFEQRMAACVEDELGLELVTVVLAGGDSARQAAAELLEAQPDVVVVHVENIFSECTDVMSALISAVDTAERRILSSRCIRNTVTPVGEWRSFVSTTKFKVDQTESDPYVKFVSSGLGGDGGSVPGQYGFGHYGWFLVEALRIADRLPGGISRSNLLIAMRSFSTPHPGLANGATFELSGNADAFGDENVLPVVVFAARSNFGAELQPTGGLINLNRLRRSEPTPATEVAADEETADETDSQSDPDQPLEPEDDSAATSEITHEQIRTALAVEPNIFYAGGCDGPFLGGERPQLATEFCGEIVSVQDGVAAIDLLEISATVRIELLYKESQWVWDL